jgi:3-phenylpropionate/trans-cinnamate dioxygenase ferredoxin reductase subunit
VRGDPASEHFSVLYYRRGRLIAADAVNCPRDYMAVRKALGANCTIPADRAANAATALKDLVTAVPSAVLA